MKKASLVIILAAGFSAQPAFADAYRLAYSKAENIEIFIDHSGPNWCSDALNMRAVYGATANPDALSKLLPKVGVLLDKQCPEATTLNWVSTDASGVAQANGTSTKASGWTLQIAAPAAASASQASVPVDTAPAAPIAPPPSEQPATAAKEGAPAASTVPAASTDAPTPPTSDAPSAAQEARAPVAEPAPEPAPEPTPQPATQSTPEPSTMPAPAAAPAAVNPAATASAAQAAPARPASLNIGGWSPASRDEVLAGTTRLRTLKDQNGCKVVSSFNLDEASLAYVTLRTEGISCDADGYATGKGKVRMERSDGQRLAQTDTVWLSDGMIFTHPVHALKLAHYADNRSHAWFDLGNDGSRFQYLGRASRWTFGSGLDGWRIDRIDVLSTQPESFRNADEIKVAVDQALNAAETQAVPNATRLNIVFADKFDDGLIKNSPESLLYSIDASRNRNWRGEITSEWRYNLQSGRNYLFQRDQIIARRKQEELRRAAYRERDNLRRYENIVAQASRNNGNVLPQLLSDVRYEPLFGNTYARLLAGQSAPVTLVVRADGKKDGETVLDWPYEIRATGADMKDGWYLVKGKLRLDDKRLDDQDLPLTLLSIDEQMPPHACQKEGCADLNDPVIATRMLLNLPDWTPEHAQQIIKQAELR